MMEDIIEKIIKKNRNIPLEFFGSSQKSLVCEAYAGEMHSATISINNGIGVKALVGGKVGFSFATDMFKVEMAVDRAIKSAKYSELAQDSFPEPRKIKKVPGIYDRKIYGMDPEGLTEMSARMLELFREKNDKVKVNLSILDAVCSRTLLMNSNGISYSSAGTAISANVEAVFGNSSGSAYAGATSLNDFDAGSLAGKASRLAVDGVGCRKAKPGVQTVVLDAEALESLFTYTLYPMLNADRVQKGQSVLEKKIGEQVAGDNLDICDIGTLDSGLLSSSFDRDGVPCRKTDIISGGVLKSFMYDYVTALREGKDSTGNGSGDFSSKSSVAPTNVVVRPSRTCFDSMISEIKDGMIIYEVMGAHDSNPITGDFSLAVAKGFKILDGAVAHPVKGAMLSGNVFDLLKNVSVVASDVRQTGHLVSPSIAFSGQKIVG